MGRGSARQQKKNAKNAEKKSLEKAEKDRVKAVEEDRKFIEYARKAAEGLANLNPYKRAIRENPKRPPGKEVEIDE